MCMTDDLLLPTNWSSHMYRCDQGLSFSTRSLVNSYIYILVQFAKKIVMTALTRLYLYFIRQQDRYVPV